MRSHVATNGSEMISSRSEKMPRISWMFLLFIILSYLRWGRYIVGSENYGHVATFAYYMLLYVYELRRVFTFFKC